MTKLFTRLIGNDILHSVVKEKGRTMKTIEIWKDNGAGEWAFFFENGTLVYAHDYAAHEADLLTDVKEFFAYGADGWEGNALIDFSNVYEQITDNPQSHRNAIYDSNAVYIYGEVR